MENSRIEWTHHTFNPWWGCHKVAIECKNCYIDRVMKRAGKPAFEGPIRTKDWSGPKRWNQKAIHEGRKRVFTCSMSDFFHEGADAWRDEAWELIEECYALDFLILTKRIDRAKRCFPPRLPRNVWIGISCGSPRTSWQLDFLREVFPPVRFISMEPLLDYVDLSPWLGWLDWVIVGGESGTERRTFELDWLYRIHGQCRDAGIPLFVKQDSLPTPGQQGRIPADLWACKEFPEV